MLQTKIIKQAQIHLIRRHATAPPTHLAPGTFIASKIAIRYHESLCFDLKMTDELKQVHFGHLSNENT